MDSCTELILVLQVGDLKQAVGQKCCDFLTVKVAIDGLTGFKLACYEAPIFSAAERAAAPSAP